MAALIALVVAGPVLVLTAVELTAESHSGFRMPLLAVSALAVLLVVLLDLRCGLGLFIVTAALSPRLPVLGYDNLRLEDGVFAMVMAVWLLRCLRLGRLPRPHSPLTVPFLVLTLLGAASTLWGLSQARIYDRTYSFLMQTKRVEYFVIFWVVATSVNSKGWLRALIFLFVMGGAAATLYGFFHQQDTTYLTYAKTRIGGLEGRNYNTFSGYLIVCLGVGVAALAEFRQGPARLAMLASVVVIAAGVLFTYSREGILMLLGSMMVLFGTRQRKWAVLGLLFLIPALSWGPVRAHLLDTVTKIQEAPHGNLGQNSLTARLHGWANTWDTYVLKDPLVGGGVGSVPLSVDNEYLVRICEGGFVGFAAFVWLLLMIGHQIRNLGKLSEDPLCRLLSTGSLAAFTGLLIQGFVGAPFTTIRTMEPFWFLLGLGACAAALYRRPGSGTVALG